MLRKENFIMIDLLTVGEPLVVFAALENNKSLADASRFQKHLAGAELNVAIGLARLGFKTEYLSTVGQDPFGDYIKKRLQAENVGHSYLTETTAAWNGFELKQRVTHGDPQTFYFRKNSAVSHIDPIVVSQIDFTQVRFLHLSGIYAATSPHAIELVNALITSARKAHTTIIFDPNLRAALWQTPQEMITACNQIATQADFVIPGKTEGQLLTGFSDPREIANFYLAQGCRAVIIKTGPQGAFFKTTNTEHFVPGFKLEQIVDTVGAGDGFVAGLISGLLDKVALTQAVLRGNAIGALATQTAGDSDNYPTKSVLQTFIKTTPRQNFS